MGANFFHCGKPGSGEVAKLVNNLMLAINMISTAEGFAMGTKLGMDPKVLNDILSVSTGRSFVVTNYNPHPGIQANAPASRDYEGGFGTVLMHKDLVLAIDAAKEAGIPVDFTKNAKAYFEDVGNQGKGHKDFSYVYEYIKGNKKV